MSQDVDELFGEGAGNPEPQARLVWALLGTGLLLSLVGMACTAAPGGLTVLLGWMVVEKDMDRLDTGYLPADARPRVQQMRSAALVALGIVIVLFFVQGALMCGGFYERWWGQLFGITDL